MVVGLGNPGKKYERTRHNLGFMVVDELAKRIKQEESSFKYEDKLKSEILQLSLILNSYSLPLILAKPLTYMNNSGLALKLLTTYYKIPASDLMVIHDDLDLPFGKIRISWGATSAGHLGVESVIKSLGMQEFARLRIGIGHPFFAKATEGKPFVIKPEDYVTMEFSEEEQKNLGEVISRAVDAVQSYLDK